MSFFSDLFEGNFSNLGKDIIDAPSSFINHPTEIAETLGVGALIAAPFILPEIGGALGLGELGAADLGIGAADLGAADAAFGAFDPALFASNVADVAAGGLGADALSVGELTALGSDVADAVAAGGESLGDIAGDVGAGGFDLAPADNVGTLGADAGPTFAQTDADLFGAQTGTPSVGTAPVASDGAAAAGLQNANSVFGAFNPSAPAETLSASTAAGGGGGIIQSLGGWGNIGKWALAGAPLALTLGMGQAQLPSAALASQNQALALQSQGLQALQDAQAGKLNTGQTAQLATMRQSLNNQWLQTLYNQGVTDPTKDSRWPQIQAMIDQQVTTATAQLIQQNITNALAETGQAASSLNAIAQMQMKADEAFTANLVNATKSLAFAAGSSSNAFKVVPA